MTFRKDDTGKPRFDLMPPNAELAVAEALTVGARDYGDNNWLQGAEWSRYHAALRRHVNAFARGEDADPKTGLPHLAHAICCALFLLEYQALGIGTDDRGSKVFPRTRLTESDISDMKEAIRVCAQS